MFLFIAEEDSNCTDASHLCVQQLVDIWTLNFLNNSNFYAVISLGHIPSNGITASHGNFVYHFGELSNCTTKYLNNLKLLASMKAGYTSSNSHHMPCGLPY